MIRPACVGRNATSPWWVQFGENDLKEITNRSNAFVVKRNWESHDTVVNLALAMGSEAGELAEILAWTGDTVEVDRLGDVRDRMAQELADITILLVRFAAASRIDIATDIEHYIKESGEKFREIV